MLARGEEPPPIGNPAQQTLLHRIREKVVFITYLFVEGDQIVSKLRRYARCKVLFRESLRLVGAVRKPHINGKVGKPGIDIDGHVGPQQMVLSLRYLAARVINFDCSFALKR